MVAWLGLLVPIAYLAVLVGSLATFSSLYRARKAGGSQIGYRNHLDKQLIPTKQNPPPLNPGFPHI